MMTESIAELNPFQLMLEQLYAQTAGQDALQKFRSKSWDHFQELGLPAIKSEVFRYLKMRQLYSESFTQPEIKELSRESIKSFIYPECDQSVIVFVNGQYQPRLSRLEKISKKVVISNLTETAQTYGALLTNHWAKSLKEETDPFVILNGALHKDGLFIYLPPKTIVEAPIQILHVIDAGDEKILTMPRVHVFVGAHSQVEFISSHKALSGNHFFTNAVADFTIEENSHVKLTQVACDISADIWHFEALRAILKKNSTLKTVCVTDGSLGIRHDYKVALTGENGEAILNGVWMLSGKREAHCHVLMDHQAPNCHSMQMYKGVVNDFGRSSFEGKIYVHQAAQKTDAFQLNNNLLLSERAMAYSKPNLEIFADDVKASHGSTVGQLDAEEMFYLKTRGFSETEAKNLLVYGYCKEVIDLITLPSLLEEVSERAKRYVIKG